MTPPGPPAAVAVAVAAAAGGFVRGVRFVRGLRRGVLDVPGTAGGSARSAG